MLITSSAKVSEHSWRLRSRGSLGRLSMASRAGKQRQEEKRPSLIETSLTRGGNKIPRRSEVVRGSIPKPTNCHLLPPECSKPAESPDESFMSRLLGGGTQADSCRPSRAPPSSFSLIMASPAQGGRNGGGREALMNLSSHFRWTLRG